MIPLRDTQRSSSAPVITTLLIAVNVAVFFYEISLDAFSRNHLIAAFGVIPDRLDPTTLLTSMFLHGGWFHLIGNMWFLWIFGDNVEDTLGHGRYLLFYLLCGVAAALTHVLLNPYSRIPTIGASGAIAGVMGAYLVKFPHARILTLIPIFIFITMYELPASLVLVYWFILQLFSGVGSVAYSQLSGGGVAWFAHIGGFITGMLLIKIFRTRGLYQRRRDLHW
ncbi:MAG TPA: rhomboid family intramembrane serine protease [Bryobacteraceae bacterium]|nr:rhomboid family intramembrane serine protease [Bryobacteraceae bacterium]HPQ14428.1 rhomboid family intramembrane serine protease [Bryobacteraceae bacterium]HPU72503.1 rhomboid family intramembrane serine protease [Bryobacteraceae bacterium]